MIPIMNYNIILDIQNVIVSADLGRPVDIDDLIKNHNAFKDLNFAAAKYCYTIPGIGNNDTDVRTATVNIFRTGKITCTGANTVGRAIQYTKRTISQYLACNDIAVRLDQIIVSGHAPLDQRHLDRLHALLPKYTVKRTELMGGMIMVSDYTTHTSFFPPRRPSRGRTAAPRLRLISRGPDEDAVRRHLEDVCRTLQIAVSDAGGATADTADNSTDGPIDGSTDGAGGSKDDTTDNSATDATGGATARSL